MVEVEGIQAGDLRQPNTPENAGFILASDNNNLSLLLPAGADRYWNLERSWVLLK